MSDSPARAPRSRLIAAFVAIYLIWGSTYLAIRFAITTIPPFTMLAARYLVAGGILYAWVRAKGAPRPTLSQWRSATIIGAGLLLVGNGIVAWAEQRLPSGVVSLLVSMTPIWMAVITWLRPGGARPRVGVMAGLVLGLLGVLLLVGPANLTGNGDINPLHAGLVVLGSLGWASASLYSRRADLPASQLMATAIEMLAGSALLIVMALITGEGSRINLAGISTSSLLSLAYLIIFGSLIAFTAYVWLLQVSTPARVSTYAYVNPVVAVLLGWGMAGEELTPRMLAAAAVIIGAVVLITYKPGRSAEMVDTAMVAAMDDQPILDEEA